MMDSQSQEYQKAADDFENSGSQFKLPHLQRWQIFLLIFVTCLVSSQIYIFLQPAMYQSIATVLTMAATDIDQNSPVADIQHVSIQQQILLSAEVMSKTAERLQQTLAVPQAQELSADHLKTMFSLTPEAGTNLLHLSAQGPTPQLLQLAINAWIESYLQIRTAFIAENTEKITNDINRQLQFIEQQVLDKRNEIDQFRIQHNISSTDSADNEVHARLQGLNKALNDAQQEEIKTKAKFDTLLDAISRNEMIVPEADSRALAVLLEKAEKLRDQFAAIEAKYTPEYIELNPNLNKIREQLVEVEAKIAEKAILGKSYARQEAENNYAAAREAVIVIKQQIQAHQNQVTDYTSRFTEHQALMQELSKLETLQQDTKQRLVDLKVNQRQNYPQVNVVDWATLPEKPVSPNYLKESLLALLICLALALLVIMISDYLNRKTPSPEHRITQDIHLHLQSQAMLDSLEQQFRVVYDPLKALPIDELPREMTHEEVQALYAAAEPVIKGIIKLLFNGLSLSEILSLTDDCLDIESLMIIIPGQRNLIMTESVAQWLMSENAVAIWPSESEVKTLFCCAAIDSGLLQPEQINIETLRFTYMLFLLRQGIRLADLTKIFGSLSPSQLGVGASFARANVPLSEIMLDYFKSAEPQSS